MTTIIITALVLVAFSGRGDDEEGDPYVYASLRAVMEGDTTSAESIPAPAKCVAR